MIGQQLYTSLKNLVKIDEQLNIVIPKIKKTQKLIENDKTEIPLLKSKIEESNKEIFNLKKELDLLELNSKELKEKETLLKTRLETSTNEKEYKALGKEAKTVELKILEQEDQLMRVWHKLENLKKVSEKLNTENKEKIKQLSKNLEIQNKTLENQTSDKNKLLEKRQEAIKDIPKEWLVKYERMKHKVSNPVVPVINSSCGACYYAILRQDLTKLKKGAILPCRNCYRFMYYDIQKEKDSE